MSNSGDKGTSPELKESLQPPSDHSRFVKPSRCEQLCELNLIEWQGFGYPIKWMEYKFNKG